MNIVDYRKVVGGIAGSVCVALIMKRLIKCDKKAFDEQGFNRNGCDRQGYAKNGYNRVGLDRAECDRGYYAELIKQLRRRLDEAYQQLQQGQFRYALYDVHAVMEEALNLIVQHTNGTDGVGDTISANIKICERKNLLGSDGEFFDKLNEVRHICSFDGYKFAAEENMNHNKVYFVIMQIKDLLGLTESILVTFEM